MQDTANSLSPSEKYTLGRTPLLWLVFPICIGLILGDTTPFFSPQTALIIALLFTALSIKISNKQVWAKAALILAAILFGYAYFNLKQIEDPNEWHTLPPREAYLDLEILETYDSPRKENTLSGVAKIINAPTHLSDIKYQKVAFYLKNTQSIEIIPTSQIKCRGLLIHQSAYPQTADADSYYQYLESRQIHFQLKQGKAIQLLQQGSLFQRSCAQIQDYIRETLNKHSSGAPASANLIYTIILGNKTYLSEEQKTQLIASGSMHFFAISGLHIGIIAGFFLLLFKATPLPELLRTALSLSVLYLYVHVTGSPPSADRAFIMLCCLLGSQFIMRKPSPMAALSASALIVLLIDPHELWSAGFQLSYTVVIAILLAGLPLGQLISNTLNKDKRFHLIQRSKAQLAYRQLIRGVSMTLSISLCASLASSALIIDHFSRVAAGGIMLNILILPLISILLINSFIALFCAPLFPLATSALFKGAWLACEAILYLIQEMLHFAPWFFQEQSFKHAWWGEATTVAIIISLCASHSLSESKNKTQKTLLLPFATAILGIIVGLIA